MAVTGLTIGVAALIIVTSVMNGFEKELREEFILEGSAPIKQTKSYETDDIFNLLNGF